MRELTAKVPPTQEHSSFGVYKTIRDETYKINMLEAEMTKLKREVSQLKQMVSTLINGKQR